MKIDIPSGYQTLIELNEPCNMSLTPDFFFSGTNYFNSTFNHNAQNSNWNSTQEYQANFNLADFNENVASVDVLIQNIEDIHGNPLLNPNGINICSIDTKNPNPTEVLLSDTIINIEDSQYTTLRVTLSVIQFRRSDGYYQCDPRALYYMTAQTFYIRKHYNESFRNILDRFFNPEYRAMGIIATPMT